MWFISQVITGGHHLVPPGFKGGLSLSHFDGFRTSQVVFSDFFRPPYSGDIAGKLDRFFQVASMANDQIPKENGGL